MATGLVNYGLAMEAIAIQGIVYVYYGDTKENLILTTWDGISWNTILKASSVEVLSSRVSPMAYVNNKIYISLLGTLLSLLNF
jgi:hypothetical protein